MGSVRRTTTLRVLKDAREVIGDPSRWCRFALADRLWDTLPEDQQAYQDAEDGQDTYDATVYVASINDRNGHGRRRLVAAMDRAISSLEEELATS